MSTEIERRISGKDVAVYFEADLVGLSKSCTIDITVDTIEASTTFSGRAKRFIPGRYSWQVTIEKLMVLRDPSVKTSFNALREGMEIYVTINVPGIEPIHGWTIVQSASLSGALGSMATYSVTLLGTGPLKAI